MKSLMKKTILALAVLGLVTAAAPRRASAWVSFSVGLPGFALFSGPPVIPPPVYAPPPVVYAPPVYYGRPYPAFYGRPYYYGYGRGWHGGWYRHGHGWR